MSVVIVVANQKGGVGKTTTAINLGSALNELGQRVLLVEMDPQSALSAGLGVEVELISAIGREYIFKEALAPVRDNYDYILVDSPPSLGLLTVNALTAADEVIIPLQCEYLALRGMRSLLETIEKVKAKLNPRLEIRGILGTMFNARTLHAQEVMNEIRSIFGDKVFDVVIKSSIRFAEAPVAHQSLLEYDPRHEGAMAYRKLAEVIVDGEKTSQPKR
jgi:chromosome partitioning protein